MNFVITPKAQDYIRNKGGSVTIRLEKKQTGCGCCGDGEVELTTIKLGEPQTEARSHKKMSVQDLDIYVHASIESAIQDVAPKIDLEWTFFGKKLVLYGLKQA